MLRYFTYIPIPTHLLLLGFIFLLHIPSFYPGFYLEEESLVLNCAKSLIENNGTLYVDVWFPGPPLMVWLYRACYFLFGNYSLIILHIVLCIYIYLVVVYFSGIIFYLKIYGRYQNIIPFVLAFLLSVPLNNQELNHTLLALLPLSYALLTFLNPEIDVRSQNHAILFKIGAGIMIGACFSYKIIPLMVGVFVAYLILRNPKISELVSIVGGILSVLVLMLLILYFNGNLDEYWDQGVLYFGDKIRMSNLDQASTSVLGSIYPIVWNWGGWIFLSIVGITHYRLRFYSYVVKIRIAERILSLWLFFGLISLIAKQGNVEIQDFTLLAPPVTFYGVKALETIRKKRVQSLMLMLAILPAVITYIHFWTPLTTLTQVGFFEKTLKRSPLEFTQDEARIFEYLSLQKEIEPIWVLTDWPDLYLRLDTRCSNKYIDFSMTYRKLPLWGNTENLNSQVETERAIYIQLTQHPPRWVVDPHRLFPVLQFRFPSILGNYTRVEDTEVLIYERKL